MPLPNSIVTSIPPNTPFVGPEILERELGQKFDLRLGANESLFGPSPLAVAAMQAQVVVSQFYGDPEGYDLRWEIAQRNGCDVSNVLLASGIDELLMLFSRAYLGHGDSALTTHGSYPTFDYAVRSVGGNLLYDLYSDEGAIDLESLGYFAQVDAPAMVYLANPDNPSSTWHSPAKIAEFRATLHSDVLFLLDEAYINFAPAAESFDAEDEGLVRLRTFSKGYGMAGIRIGYALCAASHVRALNKIRMHFGVSSVAQAGALAALQDEAHLRSVVEETTRVREWLSIQLKSLGWQSLPSHTNFLTIDMKSENSASKAVLALRRKGVFIRKPTQPPLDRFIRVSIGPQLVMEEFMSRFTDSLKSIS